MKTESYNRIQEATVLLNNALDIIGNRVHGDCTPEIQESLSYLNAAICNLEIRLDNVELDDSNNSWRETALEEL